jgi:bacillithiol biosynthesis cysteine-adding enzyme BshC
MDTACLAPNHLPHLSKLYSDFLQHFPRVRAFYAHSPSLENAAKYAREVAGPTTEPSAAQRSELVSILREQNARFGADAAVTASLDRLAAGAVAVVAGQQVGLFGGPAYTFAKTLTAACVAQQLSAQGIPAVPIFWMATEDHDIAEVSHTWWLPRGPLERLALEIDPEHAEKPVGTIPLGPGVTPLVEQACAALDGSAADDLASALRAAYRPDDTLGTSFGKLFARLLPGRGVILLDPLDPRLHRLAAPLLQRVVASAPVLNRELRARGKALEKARYHAQVKVTETSTPLFLIEGGRRVPLRLRNSAFVCGQRSYSADELRAIAEREPERVSPNALLRPVMQDALLPTAACIGGPAEIAYFAQSSVLYEQLGVPLPVILPRGAFTLVEPHVARLLRKYGLSIEDVFAGRQKVRRQMEHAYLPAGLERTFSTGARQIHAQLKKLRGPLGKLDPTLRGARDNAEKKIVYQYEKLRARAGRARDARSGVLTRHEQIITAALWPHNDLQERALNLLPFLSRHGLGLLDEIAGRACTSGSHHVLFL